MRAAAVSASMVVTGVDQSSSTSLNTSSNDGDDDPGEPSRYTRFASTSSSSSAHWHSSSADGAAMTSGVIEPIGSMNSQFANSNHQGGVNASFFVAEDVALLQDLLLDVPPSHQAHGGNDTAGSTALYPATSDSPQYVKTEPFQAPVMMVPAPAAPLEPICINSSPNSVDFQPNAFKNEHQQTEGLSIEATKDETQQKSMKAKNSTKTGTEASATEKKKSDSSNSSNSGSEGGQLTPTSQSQWLKWEDPNQVLDCAELPNASALEVRRLKNRDSMRRSRQRQRDELDKMKETVAQLESQYEELCLRTSSTTLPLLDSQPDSAQQSGSLVTAREYSYMEAIEVAKRLGAENLFLKASIQDQASWKLQLYRVLESMSFTDQVPSATAMDVDSSDDSTSTATLEREEMRAIYGFSPLSEEEVKDVILDSTRQVQGVQNELLRNQFIKSPRDRLTVFGWDIRRRMDGNEMEFAFVKRFPNASAYQIMKKTWDADLKLDRFKKIKSETRRLDILQHANANTYVLGRDVRFPDDKVVFRTVYLRFRMETSSELPSSPSHGVSHPLCKNGYVIGTQSINPVLTPNELPMLPCIADHERLVWADMTLWMEFFNVKDSATGKDFCEVRWTGKTNYKSETQAYRSAADTLLGLLRWEALAIAPVLTIC